MDKITEDILNQFQDFINYRFNKPEIKINRIPVQLMAESQH